MNKWSIDRFEGEVAVLESGEDILCVLRRVLPEDVKEGSILQFAQGQWTYLPQETKKVQEELFNLAESLFDQ